MVFEFGKVLSRIYRPLARLPEILGFLHVTDLLKRWRQDIDGAKTGELVTKRSTPTREAWSGYEEIGDLPASYRQTRITLLAVDPYLIHVYWDLNPDQFEQVRQALGKSFAQSQVSLRFYEVSGAEALGLAQACYSFEVDVQLEASNWYVHLRIPAKSYAAELGIRTVSGHFVRLARSNVAQTPRAWPSSDVRERELRVEGNYQKVQPLVALQPKARVESGSAGPVRRIQRIASDRNETFSNLEVVSTALGGESQPLAERHESDSDHPGEFFNGWHPSSASPDQPQPVAGVSSKKGDGFQDIVGIIEKKFVLGIPSSFMEAKSSLK